MAAPRKVDWERIEPEWRAGIKSVLQIAADYEGATGQKVSHTAINKHFKGLGIPRDLTSKVMAKADALVSASMVSGKVSTETTSTDAAIIDTNAVAVANVRLSQRKRIGKQTAMVDLLTEQLTAAIINREDIEAAIEEETASDMSGQRRAAMLRAVSLPTHASAVVNLSNALKTLVVLERQAFNIRDDINTSANPLADLMTQLAGKTLKPVAMPEDDE